MRLERILLVGKVGKGIRNVVQLRSDGVRAGNLFWGVVGEVLVEDMCVEVEFWVPDFVHVRAGIECQETVMVVRKDDVLLGQVRSDPLCGSELGRRDEICFEAVDIQRTAEIDEEGDEENMRNETVPECRYLVAELDKEERGEGEKKQTDESECALRE